MDGFVPSWFLLDYFDFRLDRVIQSGVMEGSFIFQLRLVFLIAWFLPCFYSSNLTQIQQQSVVQEQVLPDIPTSSICSRTRKPRFMSLVGGNNLSSLLDVSFEFEFYCWES